MLDPPTRMRVSRGNTKGRCAGGDAAAPAVPASAPLCSSSLLSALCCLFGRRVEESCAHAEDTRDWTSTETTDRAQAI